MTSELEPPHVGGRGRWMVLIAAFLGWMFDGVEMGLFPLVARPALIELLAERFEADVGWWMAIITAAFLVGAALGGVIFGWLGDRIGRVSAMIWSVLVYSIFAGLCGFAQEVWQLAVLRFIAAMGMGGEWALGVALVMEVWPSNRRPILAGLIGAAANVGFLGVAFVGVALASVIDSLHSLLSGMGMPQSWVNALLANSGWRLLLFLGAAPALLTFFIRLFVPESHRWKAAAERAPANRVADIFAAGLGRRTVLGALLAALPLLATWGSVQWIPSWTDKLVKDAHAQARQAAVDRAVEFNPDVNPGDVPDDELTSELRRTIPIARPWSQVWSGFGAVFGCILAALFAQWTSRRWAYLWLCVVALATCQYLFRGSFTYGTNYLLWVFIVGGASAAFYGWLPLYLPELFPTRIRATAQGFAFNAGRVLAAGGTFIAGWLLKLFQEDYARMGAWITLIYIGGMVLILFCPETKNRPLPE